MILMTVGGLCLMCLCRFLPERTRNAIRNRFSRKAAASTAAGLMSQGAASANDAQLNLRPNPASASMAHQNAGTSQQRLQGPAAHDGVLMHPTAAIPSPASVTPLAYSHAQHTSMAPLGGLNPSAGLHGMYATNSSTLMQGVPGVADMPVMTPCQAYSQQPTARCGVTSVMAQPIVLVSQNAQHVPTQLAATYSQAHSQAHQHRAEQQPRARLEVQQEQVHCQMNGTTALMPSHHVARTAAVQNAAVFDDAVRNASRPAQVATITSLDAPTAQLKVLPEPDGVKGQEQRQKQPESKVRNGSTLLAMTQVELSNLDLSTADVDTDELKRQLEELRPSDRRGTSTSTTQSSGAVAQPQMHSAQGMMQPPLPPGVRSFEATSSAPQPSSLNAGVHRAVGAVQEKQQLDKVLLREIDGLNDGNLGLSWPALDNGDEVIGDLLAESFDSMGNGAFAGSRSHHDVIPPVDRSRAGRPIDEDR